MFKIKKYTFKENLISLTAGILFGLIFVILSFFTKPPKTEYIIVSNNNTKVSTEEIILSNEEKTNNNITNATNEEFNEDYARQLYYIAQCVEAEAGNQGEYGKRLVTDVIINRFKQGDYINYYEVINEINQFEVVANGSIECIPSKETFIVVREEMEELTNNEILYFRTGSYHNFGTPVMQYKDHYFSK